MKHKYLLTGYSVIVVIGVCCAGLGITTSLDYIVSSINHSMLNKSGDVSRWLGETNMAFSTSVAIGSIGVALFITGKYLIQHDKAIRKV